MRMTQFAGNTTGDNFKIVENDCWDEPPIVTFVILIFF